MFDLTPLKVVSFSVGIALAMVLVGCGSPSHNTSSSADTTSSATTESPKPKLFMKETRDEDAAPQSVFEGRLSIDQTTGVVVGTMKDGNVVGIVFPAGSTIVDNDSAVRLRYSTVPIGADISIGGGYYHSAAADPQGLFDEYFFVNDE